MTTTTLQASAGKSSEATLSLFSGQNPPDIQQFDEYAILSVQTGACHVQTYLTPAECETFAAMLIKAAKEVRDLAADQAYEGLDQLVKSLQAA